MQYVFLNGAVDLKRGTKNTSSLIYLPSEEWGMAVVGEVIGRLPVGLVGHP